MQYDNFIHISDDSRHLDVQVVRKSILKAINVCMHAFSGRLLDVGCGKMPYREHIIQHSSIKEYIGVDIESEYGYHTVVKPDFFWDGLKLPFDNDEFDSVFCTEVLEHVPDTSGFLKEVSRVLKPDGSMFFTTPFLWPLHDVPHDEYRLTPFSLSRCLTEAGFRHIEIKPLGGWHASMAQMMGLWVRRSPLGRAKKAVLSGLLKPVIRYLLKKDQVELQKFPSEMMITGLYGTCKK